VDALAREHAALLEPLAGRQAALVEELVELAEINSGSENVVGLSRLAGRLQARLEPLAERVERLALPPRQLVGDDGEMQRRPLGEALWAVCRPEAPLRVLLVGHLDTVFAADHPFQQVSRRPDGALKGPGVADLKGGLLVLLSALEVLESSPWAAHLGWEVILNPDEEIGSPGSAPLLAAAARRNHLGLVYEPAMADGFLAGARKGSGNFTAVFRGRAAHAGREHHLGRNALRAMADFCVAVDELNGRREGLTVNPARVVGGGPLNTVPELAVLRFNVRLAQAEDQDWLLGELAALQAAVNAREGFAMSWHGGFGRPPKPLAGDGARLLELLADCARRLGCTLGWRDTGGCCDGNNLAAAGLPNVDTLGVVGGNLHSADEYMWPASLVERARLSALLLLRLASGELEWPPRA